MDKIKKLLNTLNVFKIIEKVLVKKVIYKGVKSGVTAFVGIIIAKDLLPKIASAGVTVDMDKFEQWAIIAGTAVVGSLWNWLKARYKFS